ncbi:MAG: hypothetical protein LBT67_00200, partial [Holosporaceae bacterium]|nr:hypothetical protein [Holosporaceae bacterium]
MLFKKLFVFLLSLCFCEKLVSMDVAAVALLEDLKKVKAHEVGLKLGQLIEEKNDTLCKLDAQAATLSKHLRLELHFGNHPSIFRSIDGILEKASGIAKVNPSLFNVVEASIDADMADTVTFELFNLLFRSGRVSFLTPGAPHGSGAIFLLANLTEHGIGLLKDEAGLFSPDQDHVVERVPTNTFGVCVRVQKEFVGADGVKIRAGSIKHPKPQMIVISIYPEN